MPFVRSNRISADTAKRVVVYFLLVVMIVCTRLLTLEWSKVPEQKTYADIWMESPLIGAPPWTELQRSTCPDGKIDAVLLRNQDDVLPLISLRLVPPGKTVKEEPPYRHLSVFLERVCRESAFTGTDAVGVSISWEGESKLLVVGQAAAFFSQHKQEEVSLGAESKRVDVTYAVSNVRYLNKP